MPIHDWTRGEAWLFQDFHLSWIVALSRALNNGALPRSHFALIERKELPPLYDFADLGPPPKVSPEEEKANADVVRHIADQRPPGRIVRRSSSYGYADVANRITIRDVDSQVVSAIEIVVPDNKATAAALRYFVDRCTTFLRHGIHLLIVDLFPPMRHDPYGLHSAIWQEFVEERTDELAPPQERPRMMVSYSVGEELTAYFETRNVGDALTDMPIFLTSDQYVAAPLEKTYQEAWSSFPDALRGRLEDSRS